MKKVAYLIASSVMISACASYTVKKPSEIEFDKKKIAGIFYTLPKKEYKLIVTYSITEFTPSKYAMSSEFIDLITPLQPDNDPIVDPMKQYSITSMELSSTSIPDPSETYFVQFEGRNNPVLKKKIGFGFSLLGSLADGSGGFKNETVNYGAQVIDMALQMATGFPVPADAGSPNNAMDSMALAKAFDSELSAIVAEILNLRKIRKIYIEGGKATEETRIQYELNVKREAQLLALINGKKSIKSETKTFNLNFQEVGSRELFKFSLENGFNAVDPKYSFKLEVAKLNESLAQRDAIVSMNSKRQEKGIHYRIPAICMVTVSNPFHNINIRQVEVVPQLGSTAYLPNRAGMFQSTIDFALDPSTGALLKYSGSSDELDNDVVTGLTSGIAENADLFNGSKAEKNQIEELERQIKLMELQAVLDSLNR